MSPFLIIDYKGLTKSNTPNVCKSLIDDFATEQNVNKLPLKILALHERVYMSCLQWCGSPLLLNRRGG